MTVAGLDRYFRSVLDLEAFARADASLNGLQAGDRGREVSRAAFAVDACMETFKRAKEGGADLLFVHHGLFWGKPLPIAGIAWKRLSFLVENDLALYACHLPLDAHPVHGNNAVLARLLGLEGLEPFGLYHGQPIGVKGALPEPIGIDEALRRILPDGTPPRAVHAFGPEKIATAGIVSGGFYQGAFAAIDEGLDLYVTGDPSHEAFHHVEEARVSMIAAGHYASEVWGVRELAERLSRDTGLPSFFIHLPTGL
jgi:dinuclear metal center YbgI/SA1388 family protein